MAALLTVTLSEAPAPARADIDPAPGVPETVTADALPTWQINGVVWKMATVGSTVYAVGSFSKARPPGTAPGNAQEVNRSNILAFDITTGNLLPFAPVLNAQARTIAVSPDQKKIYVGGDFTTVNGQTRNRVAAFDVATGALEAGFAPSVGNIVRALTVSDTTVYIGGNFFNVNGSSRTRLAAVARGNGALQPWAPTTDDEVFALLMSPDGSRVIVGGKFQALNGATRVGIGALDPASGASLPWSSNPIPARQGTNYSMTYDLATDGTNVYAAADGEGWHWFDGRFAVEPNTGDLIWLDNCYGASYGVFPIGQVLYSVGHAHDCASLGGFPEASPTRWQRALAETIYPTGTDQGPPSNNSQYSGQPVPTLLHWFPTVNAGSYTGMNQGGWSLTGNSQYLVMGGEFTTVNGAAQQGLTRFALKGAAPRDSGPIPSAALTPTAVSLASGTARVSWKTTWDRDHEKLTYQVLRGGGTTPVGEVEVASNFWTLPAAGFIDTGLQPGTTHTYRIRVVDPSGNTVGSGTSAPVTISSAGSPSPYAEKVIEDADHYWRLGESSGAVVYDHAGFLDSSREAGAGRGSAGAINGDADGSSPFSGTADGFVKTGTTVKAPAIFSIEAWVKTTSTSGGKIVGYGNAATGNSSSYDRHIYMDNSGRIWFGVYPNAVRTVNSAASYNDGQWHHVVAAQGAGGMALYVDGRRVGQNTVTTTAQVYDGHWRIGGDNLNGWPSQPTSPYLAGDIDEVAIYSSALSLTTVNEHYTASGRTSTIPPRPADPYGRAVYDDEPSLYWRLGEASGSVAADSGQNGTPGTYTATGVTYGQTGAVAGTTDPAIAVGNGRVISTGAVANPGTYSAEVWFKTTTTSGGKIMGFGNASSGTSSNYDRHIYMQNDGKLNFGTYTGAINLITTANAYNDGQWHHVVATQGPGGMALYVDGTPAGTNPQVNAEGYTGYWRIGGDNLNGWPSRPSSDDFAGSLDEAAVYSTVLTAAQVAEHWQKGSGSGPANQAPAASFTVSCEALDCTFDGSGSSDPDGTVESYAWEFGDGTTGTGATATHTYPAAGDYTVKITVTDDDAATGSATEVVAPRPAANPATSLAADAFGRSVTGGLGSADTGGPWTLSGAAAGFSVDGSAAKLGLPSAGANRRAYLNGVSTTDADVTLSVSSDKAGTGNGVYIWNIGRRISGVGDYRGRARLLSSGEVRLMLSRTDAANADTVLAAEQTVPGLTYTPGTVLKLRVRATGTSPTTLSAKVWPASGAEPAGWQLTATDATAELQAAGGVGFGAFLSGTATNAPVTVTVDDFTAQSTATAPAADFSASCAGLDCSVDATASAPGTSPIASYTWSYGDGVVGTGATASHTYAAAGTYRITLTVTAGDGQTSVTTRTVTVP
ncbi:LamG-like jellyroll fold domain-containing protein [Planobispora rosea]|uniref:LamG-like jellyroll fold domain-containing protein n=1 Tax=Planobispora rosea TaxID=35762 RepID=UPI000839E3EE|nr:LamG-like jellyroll fold domain-containing protein [Planobispora rosea]